MTAVLKYPVAKWSLAEWIIGHFRRREEVLWMNFQPEQRQETLFGCDGRCLA